MIYVAMTKGEGGGLYFLLLTGPAFTACAVVILCHVN